MQEQRDAETQTPTTWGCPQPGPSLLPGSPRLRWEARCALGDTLMVAHAAKRVSGLTAFRQVRTHRVLSSSCRPSTQEAQRGDTTHGGATPAPCGGRGGTQRQR